MSLSYRIYLTHKDHSISQPRRRAICEVWKGTFEQDNLIDGKCLSGTMELDLVTKGMTIKGKGLYVADYGEEKDCKTPLALKGGLKSDRFLYLAYHNSDDRKINFGTYLLELSSNATEFTGRLVGYGHKSQEVIAARVDLSKQENECA